MVKKRKQHGGNGKEIVETEKKRCKRKRHGGNGKDSLVQETTKKRERNGQYMQKKWERHILKEMVKERSLHLL